MNLLAFASKFHGHLAILAVALLLHPALSLWRRPGISRGMRLSATLAAIVTLAANVCGWVIYPAYRVLVKGRLYTIDPFYVDLFETKEHLAFVALVAALVGALLLWLARDGVARSASRVSQRCFSVAALFAGAAAVLGLVVASAAGFLG